MNEQDKILQENKKIKLAKLIADITCVRLYQEDLTLDKAFDLINETKMKILKIFPDKEDTYNLIYNRRFMRIIKERFGK